MGVMVLGHEIMKLKLFYILQQFIFKSEHNKTQIDYFLTRNSDRKLCKDCKIIPGESLATQHNSWM